MSQWLDMSYLNAQHSVDCSVLVILLFSFHSMYFYFSIYPKHFERNLPPTSTNKHKQHKELQNYNEWLYCWRSDHQWYYTHTLRHNYLLINVIMYLMAYRRSMGGDIMGNNAVAITLNTNNIVYLGNTSRNLEWPNKLQMPSWQGTYMQATVMMTMFPNKNNLFNHTK